MRKAAAPSPILIPSRLRLNGLHSPGDMASSEENPATVMRHSVSAPPTTTASQTPASISRRPEANTLALAEQAVAMV